MNDVILIALSIGDYVLCLEGEEEEADYISHTLCSLPSTSRISWRSCLQFMLQGQNMALHILFFQLCVAIVALPMHILVVLGLWKPIPKRFMPYLLAKMTSKYNQYMGEHKKELFSVLNDFKGPSGELKVLELGCGTGANFPFYPSGCKVTCVDPNPNFKTYLSKSLAENDHVHFQEFLVAPGENMPQVATGSMDVVICTLVLCSVENIDDILTEIHRVLRPGGAFFFLEHVTEDKSSWRYFFQSILDPTWKHLADGCQLTKETWKNLERSKFSEVKYKHVLAPIKWSPVRCHICGYALK
ncbi:thiol S-methyltransferase TMT1A-like [Dendropsophus ebraccatus]|uniref:thiol S-methyltransferase TMT1A-like n=1 Tax=Dendropsophus ebraccatus TaxID=150705 RepID=UPI003831D2D7